MGCIDQYQLLFQHSVLLLNLLSKAHIIGFLIFVLLIYLIGQMFLKHLTLMGLEFVDSLPVYMVREYTCDEGTKGIGGELQGIRVGDSEAFSSVYLFLLSCDMHVP